MDKTDSKIIKLKQEGQTKIFKSAEIVPDFTA